MLSDVQKSVHVLLERLKNEGLISDFELDRDDEGEYSGHAAVHLNGKLRKLGKFARETARVEK